MAMAQPQSRRLTSVLPTFAVCLFASVLLLSRTTVTASAHQPVADPTTSSDAPVQIDKCATMRPQVESIIGALGSVPARSRAPEQDMPALTCLYRADGAWLTVSFIAYPDRGQFERMASAVQGAVRADGLAETAFSVPPTPQQRPAGATIAAYQSGTQFTLEVASGNKSADQLANELAGLARAIALDDRLVHGLDQDDAENQHLQGGG